MCAAICRDLFLDFAPALILLKPAARRRVQALAAYARTLFDFTNDHGLEGERFAQVNRWQFTGDAEVATEIETLANSFASIKEYCVGST